MDAEINVPSVENLDMTNVLILRPGAGLIIDTHALPISRNAFLVLISTSRDGQFTFISSKLFFFTFILRLTVSHVGPRNKIGHPAHSHKRFKTVLRW